MLNEITSYEQLHQLMTRTIEGIGYIGQQLLLIETAGYSPEEYHRQRDLMLAYLIQERAKLDYFRTLSDSYLTVRHDYEMLRMLNQSESMGVMGASQADKKQLEEEIIRLSAVLPEGLKNEISGTPDREEKVEEEINSIEDLDKRIRDEQDDLVRLHEEARQLEISVLDGEEYQARKQELDRAFGQVGENLARYISMREDYTIVRSNRERIRRLGSMTPKDDAEKLEIEASIRALEKENERKSANLTSGLIESMAQKEQTAEESKDIDIDNIEEKPEKEIDIDNIEEKEIERNSEVADAVPEVEATSEEQPEESKDIDIDNTEEKEVERDSEVADAVPEAEATSEEQSEKSKDIDINNIEEKPEKEIDIDNTEEKEENLDAKLQELQEELAKAEKRLQESINAMQETYDKTREDRENNVYTTTEELDKADQEYLEVMSALNERYVANRVEVERLRKEVERVESLQRERLAEETGQEEVERDSEVAEAVPEVEATSEEQPEESKDIDIDNIEEKPEKEIDIDNTEEKEENLGAELQELKEELAEAEERLQNSINAMQEVYEFTRNYRENNLYTTVEELDSANQAYLEIMSSLNDRYVANRVEVERLRREVERVESLQRERSLSSGKVLVKERQPEEIEERKEEVPAVVPVVDTTSEEQQEEVAEESKDIDIDNIEEKQEKDINIDNTEEKPEKTDEVVRNAEGDTVVPIEIVDDTSSSDETTTAQSEEVEDDSVEEAVTESTEEEPVEEKEQTTAVAIVPENILRQPTEADMGDQTRSAEVQDDSVGEAVTGSTEEEPVEEKEQTTAVAIVPENILRQPTEADMGDQTRSAEVQDDSVEEAVTEPTEEEPTEETDTDEPDNEEEKEQTTEGVTPVPVDGIEGSEDEEAQEGDSQEDQEGVAEVTEEPEDIERTTPESEEDQEESIEDEEEMEVEQPKRGLQTIVASILVDPETNEPINMTVKQRKRLERSNISITGALKNGLSYGNYLYNLTSIAPTIIGVIPNVMMKLAGKIMLTRKAKENIRIVRENLDNLSDEDLEVLYREFRGDAVVNLRGAAAVTGLIKEAVERYQERRYIAPKRAEMKITYAKILSDYETIENNKVLIHQITSGTMSSTDAQTLIEKLGVANLTQAVALLETRNNRLMSTKAQEIGRVRELGRELQPELSGGKHGFAEDVRSTDSKMNLQGRRFAKDISTGAAQEIMAEMGKLQDAEAAAVERGDNETALTAFIKLETTQARESKMEGSIFGKRDTGVYHYHPIPEELDYRPDPFVRNVLTTVTTAAIVKGMINEFHNRMMEAELRKANQDVASQQKVIDDVNQRNAEASAHNAVQGQAVQQSSSQLTGSSESVKRGMEAQVDQNIAATRATHEYMDHDATGWSFNDAYHAAEAHHTAVQNAAEDAQAQLSQIHQDLAAGRITDVQAMRQIAQVNSDTHSMFQQAVQEAIPVFKEYAQAHPNFEYEQYIAALERLGSDPTAIDALNQSAINAVEIGQSLEGITILPYEQLGLVLQEVPTGIKSQLFLLGSAALMTGQAAAQAQQFSKQSDNEEILSALDKVVERDQERSERHAHIEEARESLERSNGQELSEMTGEAPVVEGTSRTR